MLYLKLVPIEFGKDSRDKRELSAVKNVGYETLVLDTTKKAVDFKEIVDGHEVLHISTRRYGKFAWMHTLNRGMAYLRFIRKIIEVNPDVVSGHDYLMTLAAYIANYCKQRKAKLVYDSHEFELYQDPSRSKLALWMLKLVEGFLIRRVDLALMVGDKIADGVQEIYKLRTRPTVIRNIPAYWHLEQKKSLIVRQHFQKKLGLSTNGFLLMYHGGIMSGRGIECAIRAISLLPEDTGLVIMGYETEPGTLARLRVLAEEKDVISRILFHPAVSVAELKDYIGAVDVELVLIEGRYCVSYEYSLPNKFFESIQACVPMVCSDLPEIGEIVRQYDIGLLAKENDVENVAEAVMKLRNDKRLYVRLKQNMEKAKKDLCWEKESLKLQKVVCELERKEGSCVG